MWFQVSLLEKISIVPDQLGRGCGAGCCCKSFMDMFELQTNCLAKAMLLLWCLPFCAASGAGWQASSES